MFFFLNTHFNNLLGLAWLGLPSIFLEHLHCSRRPATMPALASCDHPEGLLADSMTHLRVKLGPCLSVPFSILLSLTQFFNHFFDQLSEYFPGFSSFLFNIQPLALYVTKSIVHGTLPIFSPPGIEWHKAIYTSFSQLHSEVSRFHVSLLQINPVLV